jgi:hypothetical protein
MRNRLASGGLVLIVAAAGFVGGCKQDQPKRKYIEPIEGTALEINPDTNEVSMEFVHPDTQVPIVRKGYVTPTTKVDINGITARIEDVRKGDTVRVTGYQEGPRENRKFYVASISVRRAGNDWLDTAAPASGPASRPAE